MQVDTVWERWTQRLTVSSSGFIDFWKYGARYTDRCHVPLCLSVCLSDWLFILRTERIEAPTLAHEHEQCGWASDCLWGHCSYQMTLYALQCAVPGNAKIYVIFIPLASLKRGHHEARSRLQDMFYYAEGMTRH